jgi:hypothetical protein
VQVTTEIPSAYGPEVTIRFFPDYSLKHPLWFWFGHPDFNDLQLPADLDDRLHRWFAYWDTTFHWDDGWPAGSPETWWTEEEEHLPRDIAIAFGSDFVIEVDSGYLHSTTDADSPHPPQRCLRSSTPRPTNSSRSGPASPRDTGTTPSRATSATRGGSPNNSSTRAWAGDTRLIRLTRLG